MISIDMKVIDKGLCGKGHSDPFIKLVGEHGSSFKVKLGSRAELDHYEIDEIFVVKIINEQQKLTFSEDELR